MQLELISNSYNSKQETLPRSGGSISLSLDAISVGKFGNEDNGFEYVYFIVNSIRFRLVLVCNYEIGSCTVTR